MKKLICLITALATVSGLQAQKDNVLSKQEKKAGWQLLFDGETTKGWRNFNKKDISDLWKVENGTLMLSGKGGGDIVTEAEYENFEFSIDWKISEKGNSGIFYLVKEGDQYGAPYHTGPEYQILDNKGHGDGKYPNHQAGSNYDLIVPSKDVTKTPGAEWNTTVIKIQSGKVEHWLNGEKMVEYELWTDEWKKMVAASKFKKWPDYGMHKSGRISLQDHSDQVWFKNIKIKKL